MTTTYRVLGQANPVANTPTTLYTVPAATQAIGSTLAICNQAGASATYRVAIRPSGAALAAQHYLAYDITVNFNDTTTLTLGISLGATDVVTVQASTGTVSFSLFGIELT